MLQMALLHLDSLQNCVGNCLTGLTPKIVWLETLLRLLSVCRLTTSFMTVQCRCRGTSPFYTVHWHTVWACIDLPVFLLCSHDIKQLAERKYMYHVTSESGKSWVVKVVATPYPWHTPA